MGDFPLMTDRGTFIINGAERGYCNATGSLPAPYYAAEIDKTGKEKIIFLPQIRIAVLG